MSGFDGALTHVRLPSEAGITPICVEVRVNLTEVAEQSTVLYENDDNYVLRVGMYVT
jgi:hypothetical protein